MAKILLCCMNYRPEMISTGKYAFELCEFLAASGHSVEAITTPPHYPGWRVFPGYSAWRFSRERLHGVKVWRVPMLLDPKATGIVRIVMPMTWALLSLPVLLYRALVWRPDVVIAVQPTITMAPGALAAAMLSGARTVQHVQDLEIDTALAVGHVRAGRRMRGLAYAVERWLMRRFDRVVTISDRMRARLIAKGIAPERVTVVRNWVDTTLIAPISRPSVYRDELGIPDDRFVVQYSGQLGRKQALHLIVEAAAQLERDPRFLFVIAGDGPMRGELEGACAGRANVMLLPLQPTERLGEFLALADCHILTQEADVGDLVLPSKLGGMLASGRRMLITADRGSELDIFLGDSATFTPPSDSGAIVAALTQMIDTSDTSAPARARLTRALDAASVLPAFERLLLAPR